jgi:hypothetical protein
LMPEEPVPRCVSMSLLSRTPTFGECCMVNCPAGISSAVALLNKLETVNV